jgi:hypothetical protein
MTEYKILIVYDVDGWAYHFEAEALKKYAPQDFSVTIASSFEQPLHDQDYHLVYFLPFNHVGDLRAYCDQIGRKPAIATSFSVGWGYANDWLDEAREHSDAVILSNLQMWNKSARLENTYYLPKGVDRDIFKCDVSVETRTPRILWCGSQFHRKIKGYDDVLVPLAARLGEHNLPVDLRLVDSAGQARYSRTQMAQWYNTGTIYICTSLAEGTPFPTLEAAACGCTIVSTPVGNMPELIEHGANGFIVKWDVDAFLQHILLAVSHQTALSQNMLKAVEPWSWQQRSKGFYDLFRQLINVKCPI